MTIGSTLIGVALVLLVGLYLARPFLKREIISDHPATRREQLLNEKEAILTQIQQLDFDVDTGKIPSEVHQSQREEMVAEAAQILKALDELESHPSAIDAEIEAAVARIRQGDTAVAKSVPAARNGKGGYCSQCGSPTDAGDKFCTNCGHKLQSQKVQPATS